MNRTIGYIRIAIGSLICYNVIYWIWIHPVSNVCSILLLAATAFAVIFAWMACSSAKYDDKRITETRADMRYASMDAKDAKKDIKRLEERIAELEKKLGEKNGIS